MENTFTPQQIEDWLIHYISEALELPRDEVDPEASFDQFGLESSAAAAMTGDLAKWLKRDIDPTLVFDFPSIAKLAEKLTETSA